MVKNKIINDYFPMLKTMILNALCSVIEDDDVITVRLGMDFLINRFPLNEENILFDDEEKTYLLISVLKLYIKNEYSTTRRLSNWLLGNLDDEININSPQIQYVLKLVIKALKQIFDINNKDITFIQLKNNIKLIDLLINQQVELSDDIIENISYDIIYSVVNYWRKELNEKEDLKDNEIIHKIGNFFNKDSSFLQWLWISLAKNLEDI